jgi:hypothetical protein
VEQLLSGGRGIVILEGGITSIAGGCTYGCSSALDRGCRCVDEGLVALVGSRGIAVP